MRALFALAAGAALVAGPTAWAKTYVSNPDLGNSTMQAAALKKPSATN